MWPRKSQRHANGDLLAVHDALAVLLAIAVGPRAAGDVAHVAEMNLHTAYVETLDAGVTDRGEDASPVRIAREQRGLDQRRMGDSVGDAPALGLVTALADLYGDELRSALGVADHGLGKRERDGTHGLGQRRVARFFDALDARRATCAARQAKIITFKF